VWFVRGFGVMLKRTNTPGERIMSDLTQARFIDGYSGFPLETRSEHGAQRGTVEWLLDAVERHATAEADALDQYEYIATASGDPIVALVMRLILEDEERHHGLLKRIEASLRDALNWTHSPNALPASGMPEQPVASQLAAAARALIEEERTGAHYLRGVAHLEKDIDSGLHTLLLEMMAMDSEKHARLLQFVHDRLAARARTDDGPGD
jgi:rubrerythrin